MSEGVIALDVGGRYIGIAARDHAGDIAYRYATIDRKKQDAFQEIRSICDKEDVGTIVVGIPYHVEDGSETEQTRIIRSFVQKMHASLERAVDVVEIDETLTSREAKRLLAIEGASQDNEHAEAARLLLSEYLAQSSYLR